MVMTERDFVEHRKGVLVIVCGRIGTGKTSLAMSLGKRLGYGVVSEFFVRKKVAWVPFAERGGAEMYSDIMEEKVYPEMLAKAYEAVNAGRSLIIDASFRQARWRDAAREVAEKAGARFVIVETEAGANVVKKRLAIKRVNSDFSYEDYCAEKYEEVLEEHIIVDTAKQTQLQHIGEMIGGATVVV